MLLGLSEQRRMDYEKGRFTLVFLGTDLHHVAEQYDAQAHEKLDDGWAVSNLIHHFNGHESKDKMNRIRSRPF